MDVTEENGNMEDMNNTERETTGHPSQSQQSPAIFNDTSVRRSPNSNLNDKLTSMVHKLNEEDVEEIDDASLVVGLEGNSLFPQNTKTINNNHNSSSMNSRQHNFNNRDMELSLGNSDEEDDDEEEEEEDEERDNEENDQRNLEMQLQRIEMEHQGDYGDIQFFHHKLLLQQHLGHNEFGIGSSSSFGSASGLVNSLRNASASCVSGGSVDSFHIEECDDNGISNSFSVSFYFTLFSNPYFLMFCFHLLRRAFLSASLSLTIFLNTRKTLRHCEGN